MSKQSKKYEKYAQARNREAVNQYLREAAEEARFESALRANRAEATAFSLAFVRAKGLPDELAVGHVMAAILREGEEKAARFEREIE